MALQAREPERDVRTLWDLKGLVKPMIFEGDPNTWRQFKEEFLNVAAMLQTGLDEVLEKVLCSTAADVEGFELENPEASKMVYTVLRAMCGSIPRTIVAAVHRGDGWTAWRRLAAEYEVHGAAGRLADLSKLLRPRWDELDFLRCWQEWEKDPSEFELKYGQAMSSDVKCAIVADSLPPGVRQLLRCMPADLLEDYSRLRKIVKEM